jgi:hypothetical protein
VVDGNAAIIGGLGLYRVPTRCMLNLSPRGQVTLFFFLQ